MARIFLSGELRRIAGGEESLEIDARSVRDLVDALEERFPGMRARIDGMAVAIDGEILPDAFLEAVEPESEIHFLPPVRGG